LLEDGLLGRAPVFESRLGPTTRRSALAVHHTE
jgi:hypothetical protein